MDESQLSPLDAILYALKLNDESPLQADAYAERIDNAKTRTLVRDYLKLVRSPKWQRVEAAARGELQEDAPVARIKVGDVVEDQYGEVGTVNRQYDDFTAVAATCLTMTGDMWLSQQRRPFTQAELDERWFAVLCVTGGSIWSCESRLRLVR